MERLDLILLRNIFRTRMEEQDFCIGQEQVEKLFRELLGEPEPELPKYEGKGISSVELAQCFKNAMKNIQVSFEREDTFFSILRKK